MVTVRLLVLADETVACTAPIKTMFDAAVALKFVPEIIRLVPANPLLGPKLLMDGTACGYARIAVSAPNMVMVANKIFPGENLIIFFMANAFCFVTPFR